MQEIKWKDGVQGGTKIPNDILKITFKDGKIKKTGMLRKFWELGYIEDNQPANAKFLNKYHFEKYIDEYKQCKNDKEYKQLADKIFGGKI